MEIKRTKLPEITKVENDKRDEVKKLVGQNQTPDSFEIDKGIHGDTRGGSSSSADPERKADHIAEGILNKQISAARLGELEFKSPELTQQRKSGEKGELSATQPELIKPFPFNIKVLDLLPEKITSSGADDQGSVDDRQIAEQLTALPGIDMSAEEIFANASDEGIDLSVPPAVPNSEVYRFLVKIDPVLANLLEAFKNGNEDERTVLFAQIRDRVVSLLQILYPNAGVTDVSDKGWAKDNIMFAGHEIDIIVNVENIDQSDELWEILGFKIQNSEGHRN